MSTLLFFDLWPGGVGHGVLKLVWETYSKKASSWRKDNALCKVSRGLTFGIPTDTPANKKVHVLLLFIAKFVMALSQINYVLIIHLISFMMLLADGKVMYMFISQLVNKYTTFLDMGHWNISYKKYLPTFAPGSGTPAIASWRFGAEEEPEMTAVEKSWAVVDFSSWRNFR